jgi:hypothetical protein
MCPDCQRIASENARLQRIKIVADSLVAALHIRYTGDSTDLSRIMKHQIDAYEHAIKETQVP